MALRPSPSPRRRTGRGRRPLGRLAVVVTRVVAAVAPQLLTARRSHPAIDGPSQASRPDAPGRHPSPPATHLACAHGPPDADGFHLVESRRCWRRRSPPWQSRLVPPELVGKCFNCLDEGHVRANYGNPPRYLNCSSECHRRRDCPSPPLAAVGGKRCCSPSGADTVYCRRVVLHRGRRRSTGRSVTSNDIVSGRSVSIGRSTSVP